MIELNKSTLKGTDEFRINTWVRPILKAVLISLGLTGIYFVLFLFKNSILNEWLPYHHLPNSRLILALNNLGLIVFNS